MLKMFISSWILVSSSAFAKSVLVKKVDSSCLRKGIVESTFGKEIYDDWSVWDSVKVFEPAPVLESLLKKAEGLGGNRVVITGLDPVYLTTHTTTHGDYASHATTSFSAVTVRGTVYACK
jgi:hypothetical protein